jgi:TRAP-type mannitol/chloroaromatic compound transport system substrate-binding protein
MTRVFISYRRDDSAAYAGRLYDRLTAHFGQGQVFMDIDQIEPGEDFVDAIERTVSACESAVVLIGKGWLSAADSDGARRIDDPDDFVRLEVAAALTRKIKVFPVLVGGAAMPKTPQLPEPLQMLARRNAIEISDTRFHADVNRLIEAVAKSLGAAPGATQSGSVEPTPETVNITGGAIPRASAPEPSPPREIPQPPVRAPEPLEPTIEVARPAAPDLQSTRSAARRSLVFAGIAAAVVAAAIGLASMFRTSAPSREPEQQAAPAGESTRPTKAAGSASAGGLVKLRTQDSYASNDKRSVALHTFAKTLRDVPGVRIELEVLPSGSVVRAFEALDAVGQGALDAAWVSASVFYGKSPAFALLDGTPFGRSPRGYMQWRQDPKVKAIADELYGKFGAKGLQCGVTGPNVDLWSRKKIYQPSDLKGLPTRAAGIWSDIFTAAGAAVSALPAGEIYPALSRGILDAVHLSDLPLGAALGLPSVTKHVYFPGIMTSSAGVDLIVNASVWNGLNAQAKDAIELTCQRNVEAMLQAGDAETRHALASVAGGPGVTVAVLPQPVTSALHRAWMRVATDKSADPMFARLFDTVRAPAPTQ